MKLFTVDEANELLSQVGPMLEKIRKLYNSLDELRGEAEAAARSSGAGGGMTGGAYYVSTLYRIGKLTTELSEMGVELKDHARGLIDLPSMRGDRLVYLCWQLGEGDEVRWWHDIDAGFAGRQPL